MPTESKRQGGAGLGVDAAGNAVIDPTENVKALVEALNERQDDLRAADSRLVMSEVNCLRRELALRGEHDKEIRRKDEQLSELNDARLASIRNVDIINQKNDADRLNEAVRTQAQQRLTDADNLRTLVTSTATTYAEAQESRWTAYANTQESRWTESNKRLSALELSISKGEGKQTVADPQLLQMADDMRALRESRATGTGRTAGINWVFVAIAGAVSMFAGMLTIAGVLYAVLKH